MFEGTEFIASGQYDGERRLITLQPQSGNRENWMPVLGLFYQPQVLFVSFGWFFEIGFLCLTVLAVLDLAL